MDEQVLKRPARRSARQKPVPASGEAQANAEANGT